MPWNGELRTEIDAEFANREGCMDYEAARKLTVVPETHIGAGRVGRVGRDMPAKRRYERARLSDPDKRAKENQRMRVSRLKKNVKLWMRDAKNICVGRCLDPAEWVGVMLVTSGEIEIAARRDFIYFLKHCREIGETYIASMLQMTKAEVLAELAERK